jgi:hypothetical protein
MLGVVAFAALGLSLSYAILAAVLYLLIFIFFLDFYVLRLFDFFG